MTGTYYLTKMGTDGVKRIFVQTIEQKIVSTKQAKKADIKRALEMHTRLKVDFDDALLEFVK